MTRREVASEGIVAIAMEPRRRDDAEAGNEKERTPHEPNPPILPADRGTP